MDTIGDLDELAALLERAGPDQELYLRWSEGPEVDLGGSQPGGGNIQLHECQNGEIAN